MTQLVAALRPGQITPQKAWLQELDARKAQRPADGRAAGRGEQIQRPGDGLRRGQLAGVTAIRHPASANRPG